MFSQPDLRINSLDQKPSYSSIFASYCVKVPCTHSRFQAKILERQRTRQILNLFCIQATMFKVYRTKGKNTQNLWVWTVFAFKQEEARLLPMSTGSGVEGHAHCSLFIAQYWTWKESGRHLSKHPDNVWARHCFLFYAFVKTPTRHFLFCACISLSNFLVFLLLLLWQEKLKVKCSHPGLQFWL